MTNRHHFKASSSIAHIDYDDAEGTMQICFIGSGTYHYKCDKSEYEDMKKASSPGTHFAQRIRPKYKHVAKS